MTSYTWQEVPCARQITAASFAQGLADYQFSVGRPMAFIPAQSYFRVEVSVYAGVNTRPSMKDQIALAESACGNMWSSAYFQAGSQNVSSISQYLPQAAALQMRQSPSWAWQKSLGQSACAQGAFLSNRIAALSSSGTAQAAPTRLSQDPGADETYRPAATGSYAAATVAITAAGGVVTGANTAFAVSDIGSTLVVNGASFTIISRASATAVVVSPAPSVDTGATTNFYCVRRNLTSSLEGRNTLNLIFKPSMLGIMNHTGVLGSGSYRLQMSPNANFRTSMIETGNPDFAVIANSYTVSITNCTFYAAMLQMDIPDSVQDLQLEEVMVLSQNMASASSVTQWTIPPSTYAITVFVQSNLAGTDPRFPPSRFITANRADLDLTAIQLTYAGQTRPQTRWLSGFSTVDPDSKSYLSQLYFQSVGCELGNASAEGGAESESEWMARGPCYTFRFAKDESNRSTECQLSLEFGTTTAWDVNSRVFLVAEYMQGTRITHAGGVITRVEQSIG